MEKRGTPEGKRPLGRPRRRCVDNIKMDLREIGWDGVEWNWMKTGTSGEAIEHGNMNLHNWRLLKKGISSMKLVYVNKTTALVMKERYSRYKQKAHQFWRYHLFVLNYPEKKDCQNYGK
jgi:hypothetical protein